MSITPTVGRKRFAFDIEDLQSKGFVILSVRMRPDQLAEAAEWPEVVGDTFVSDELRVRFRLCSDASAVKPVIYEVVK